MIVTHATVSTVTDEHVPGEIGPDDWNENHTISGINGGTVTIMTNESSITFPHGLTGTPIVTISSDQFVFAKKTVDTTNVTITIDHVLGADEFNINFDWIGIII